jgi:hypothetical protein
MSAFAEYVRAVVYQFDLLDCARDRDSFALLLQTPRPGARRIWTRQDVRRREYEAALKEAQYPYPEPSGRMDTRLWRIARKHRLPDHRPALSEAKDNGTFSTLSPLIVRLAKCYEALRAAMTNETLQNWEGYAKLPPPERIAKRRFNRAMEAIRRYVAPDVVKKPSGGADHYVTLRQAAAMVSKSKDTLEPLVGNSLPEPDIRGGNGKASEWRWSNIRPALERHFDRPLPERFPSDLRK